MPPKSDYDKKMLEIMKQSRWLARVQDLCAVACQTCGMRGPWIGSGWDGTNWQVMPQCFACRSDSARSARNVRRSGNVGGAKRSLPSNLKAYAAHLAAQAHLQSGAGRRWRRG